MTLPWLSAGEVPYTPPVVGGVYDDDMSNAPDQQELYMRTANPVTGAPFTWDYSLLSSVVSTATPQDCVINAADASLQDVRESGASVKRIWHPPPRTSLDHYVEIQFKQYHATDRFGPAVRCDPTDLDTPFYLLGATSNASVAARLFRSDSASFLAQVPADVDDVIRIEVEGTTIRLINVTQGGTSSEITEAVGSMQGLYTGIAVSRGFPAFPLYGGTFTTGDL